MLKNLVHLLWLTLIAVVAVLVDILLYAFTTTCASCATFSQFLASPYSLFAPIWLSLVVVLKKIYLKKSKVQKN